MIRAFKNAVGIMACLVAFVGIYLDAGGWADVTLVQMLGATTPALVFLWDRWMLESFLERQSSSIEYQLFMIAGALFSAVFLGGFLIGAMRA